MRQWMAVPVTVVLLVVLEVPGPGVWGAAAAVLISGVLFLAMDRATASGPPLIVGLSGLLFVATWLITLPEAVLFDVIGPGEAVLGITGGLVTSVAAVTVMAAVAGRLDPGNGTVAAGPIRSTRGLLWRLAAVPAVFTLLYFAAGMIIYPLVEPYYQGRVMPEPATIASMQVLRSLALVAAAYPLLRILGTRRDSVLVLGLALPVFGALAPLLPPNDLMPASVRLVHALETVPYYALFGALLAVWFGPAKGSGSGKPLRSAGQPERAEAMAGR